MNDKLVATLDKLLTWVESSKDFLQEQAPLVVQEILVSERIENLGVVIIGAVVFAIAATTMVWAIKTYDRREKAYGEGEMGNIFAGLAAIIGIVVSSVISLNAMCLVAKTFYCPRLVVLQVLKGMM